MSNVFMVGKDKISPLKAVDYRKDKIFGKTGESLLQHLIESHPEIIPTSEFGEQLQLCTITVEAGVTSGSIDIVTLCSDAVMAIIEVKLADNREIRRQIFGQGMEYAANIVRQWSSERIIKEAEEYRKSNEGLHPLSEVISSWCSDETKETKESEEEFWSQVDSNLKSGRIRIIFAGDRFPDELLNAIEFLNEQTENLTITALECDLYSTMEGDNILLIPTLKGMTVKSKIARTRPGQIWNNDSFYKEVSEIDNKDACDLIKNLLEFTEENADENPFSRKSRTQYPTFNFYLKGKDRTLSILNISVYPEDYPEDFGLLKIYFNGITRLTDEQTSSRFKKKLRQILQEDIPDETKEYLLSPTLFLDELLLKKLKSWLHELIKEIHRRKP